MQIPEKFILFSLLTVLTLLSGCVESSKSSSPGKTQDPPQQGLSIAGTVSAVSISVTDSDINDTLAGVQISNNGFSTSQDIPNPAVIGGYLNVAGFGPQGQSFLNGDQLDYYFGPMKAGQNIVLQMSEDIIANDLDLFLYNQSQLLVLASMGTGSTESLVVPGDGDYYILVAACGPTGSDYDTCTLPNTASKYVLTIGAETPVGLEGQLQLNSNFVSYEAIVRNKPSAKINTLLYYKKVEQLKNYRLKAGGLNQPVLLSINKRTDIQSLNKVSGSKTTLVALQDKINTIVAIKKLRALDATATADLNYIRKPFLVPPDILYPSQWHYGFLNLEAAWDSTQGSANVVVAVIDTGVLSSHPDLSPNLVPGYDFVSDDTRSNDGDEIDSDAEDPGDGATLATSSWHGTHVAGTIAAASSSGAASGMVGVAPLTRIMPVRVLARGGGTSFDILQGVRYAAGLSNSANIILSRPVDIINLSLGGPGYSQTEQDTYNEINQAGIIVIAAAGNNGSTQQNYPASYNNVVAVSATDMILSRAPYSNFGPNIDVSAPGGDFGADLDVNAEQDGIWSTSVSVVGTSRNPGFAMKEGTSMASPQVAGVVALMKARKPDLTPDEFYAVLRAGSITDDIGVSGRDNDFGYGIINAQKAVMVVSSPILPTLITDPQAINFGVSRSEMIITTRSAGNGPVVITNVSQDSPGWLTIQEQVVDGAKLGTYVATINRSVLAVGLHTAIISFSTDVAGIIEVPVSVQVPDANGLIPGDAGQQYISLLKASNRMAVQTVTMASNFGRYPYQFTGLLPGSYIVISGSDLDNDGFICSSAEACGMYPYRGEPVPIDLVDQNLTDINFDTGFILPFGFGMATGNDINVRK